MMGMKQRSFAPLVNVSLEELVPKITQPIEKEMQRMFQRALPRLPKITIAAQQQHFQAVFVRQELQYRSLP